MKSQKYLIYTLFFALVGCSTVPETGRRQLNFISDAQLVPAATAQYQEMQNQVGVSQNQAMQNRIERIGKQIVEVAIAESPSADLPPPDQWKFTVFASEEINAFAMPGGLVGFYEGIMEKFENDDQLAAVMAHEIGHVVAKHGNERVSQQMGMQIALTGSAVALDNSKMSNQNKQLLMTALGAGAQIGVILPFSRAHESEADYLGLLYMTRAGYDPQEAVDFWKIMMESSQGQPPEWLSTHPSNATRIHKLQEQIPQVKEHLGM